MGVSFHDVIFYILNKKNNRQYFGANINNKKKKKHEHEYEHTEDIF